MQRSFCQRGFLGSYMSADDDRRVLMLSTPFATTAVDQKVPNKLFLVVLLIRFSQMLMTKRAEKKKLEIKWEAVKGLRNEYKSKV